jgi:TolB protein
LQDVQAPHPLLHDAVDEAFVALRQRVMEDAGWDVLGNLENAYTPLTSSLDPGKGQDWLYTGRAFALNPLTAKAGWMLTLREEIDGQTYWRLYLRAVAQDGSVGEPLRQRPWDLNARYNLDPQAYDQGGAYAASIPTGYWIDFTDLARQFGWERIPAQNDWRSYFKGAQFNEFILTGGLDWRSAMLQLYPPDVFVTPTIVIPPTKTLTITPTGYRYKSPTPTVTFTPTPRPTFTPAP